MKQKGQGNTIAGGFVWKFGERLLIQGVSFIVSLVLARLLSPDDYGVIALVMVFINLAGVFITSGFATALIQKRDADKVDFSTMFYCSLLCSLLIYLVVYLLAPTIAAFYEKPIVSPVLRVYALQIPLSVYNSIQIAYVSRNMQFRKTFLASLFSAVVSGVVGIAMAYLKFGVWALVGQSIVVTVVNTIVLAFTVSWHPQLLFSGKSAKSMMRYGSRVLMADLSGTFFNEVRSLIIGRVYTSADLAYYTKGQQLPTLITSNVNTSIVSVLFPAMANESDDYSKVKVLAKRSSQLLSYVMFPMLFGMAAVMAPLVYTLFTEKWAECIPYGQLLCIGSAISVMGIVPLQTLKAIGRSDVLVRLEFIKKPIYLISLIIGVRINVLAIAVSMVVYEVYGVIVNMLQMKKYIGYSLGEQLLDVLPAFALSTVMALGVVMIPSTKYAILTLAVKGLAGCAFYVVMSIVFRFHAFQYLKNYLFGIFGREKNG